MATKAKSKQPSPAQLRARRKFVAMAKARAKLARLKKKAAAPKKRVAKKAPSAAQLRARKKFAAAAKARAKAARAGRRNSTSIRAKRIDHLDVSKVHNPRRGMRAAKAHGRATEKRLTKRGEVDAAFYAKLARKEMQKLKGYQRRPAKLTAALERRKNAEHRDAQHPIHVTDYWQGRKGYKSQWQRAHDAGQRQLFGVKNPFVTPALLREFENLVSRLPERKEMKQAEAHYRLLLDYGASVKEKAAARKKFHVAARKYDRKVKALQAAFLKKHKIQNGKRVVSRATRSNGAGSALARKRRAEFVGRPSKKTISSYAPKGSGAKPHSTLVAMGKLKKVYIKGRTPLNFNGRAILAHDPKTDKMFVLGKEYTLKHLKKNPDGFEDLGEVTRLEYEATKTHLGDSEPVTYFHKCGEEGGEKPHAVINEENLLLLEGGDYYITPEGIRD